MASPWGAGAPIGALSGSWAMPRKYCSPQVETWTKRPQESLQVDVAFPRPGGQVSRVARRRPLRGLCRGLSSLPQVAVLCRRQSWAHPTGWSFQSESKKWIEKRTFPTKIKGKKKNKGKWGLSWQCLSQSPTLSTHPQSPSHSPETFVYRNQVSPQGLTPDLSVCLTGSCVGHTYPTLPHLLQEPKLKNKYVYPSQSTEKNKQGRPRLRWDQAACLQPQIKPAHARTRISQLTERKWLTLGWHLRAWTAALISLIQLCMSSGLSACKTPTAFTQAFWAPWVQRARLWLSAKFIKITPLELEESQRSSRPVASDFWGHFFGSDTS